MSYQAVTYSGKLDAKNLPMINQHYLIPLPSSLPTYASARDKRNAVAIQSMWKHFLDQVTDPPVRLSQYIPSHLALSSVLLDQVSDPPDCLSLIHIPPSLTIHLVTPCIPSMDINLPISWPSTICVFSCPLTTLQKSSIRTQIVHAYPSLSPSGDPPLSCR